MRTLLALVRKDFALETGAEGVFPATAAFAVVIAAVFHFSSVFSAPPAAGSAASGMLWVLILFAGALGLARSSEFERRNMAVRSILMSPVDRGAVFAAKAFVNLAVLLAVEAVFIPVFALFSGMEIMPVLFPFISVMVAGTVGFVAVGTLLSAVSSQVGAGDILLPVLLFPISAPVLISASQAVSILLTGGSSAEFSSHMKVLLSFDLAFTAAGIVCYEYVIEEG